MSDTLRPEHIEDFLDHVDSAIDMLPVNLVSADTEILAQDAAHSILSGQMSKQSVGKLIQTVRERFVNLHGIII